MFEGFKKVLKRNCKHQGRNITIGTVVGVLLSCNMAMAVDENGFGYEFKFDGTDNMHVIEHYIDDISTPWTFEENNTTEFEGKLSEDKWDKGTMIFTQNGSINIALEGEEGSIKDTSGTLNKPNGPINLANEKVYGLRLTDDDYFTGAPFTFIQNGTITSSYIGTNLKDDTWRTFKGNGLVIDRENITVNVNGNIKGEVKLFGANNNTDPVYSFVYASVDIQTCANGLYSYRNTGSIDNITGNIKGNVIATGGNEIEIGGNSFAEAYVKAMTSANGVYSSNSIGNITGNIEGNAFLMGGNNAADKTNADTYVNSMDSANGIKAGSNINNIAGNVKGNGIFMAGNEGYNNGNGTSEGYVSVMETANGIRSVGNIGNVTGDVRGNVIVVGRNETTNDISAIIGIYVNAYNSANGIHISGSIGDITGNINGFGVLQRGSTISTNSMKHLMVMSFANGIDFSSSSDIENSGKVQGSAGLYDGDGITPATNEVSDMVSFSGNGIAIETAYDNILNNKGLIVGSESAVAVSSIGTMGAINNYGIMAGKKILGDGQREPNDIVTDKFKNDGLNLIIETKHDDKKHSLVVNKIDDSYVGGVITPDQNNSGYTIWNAEQINTTTETKSIYLENGKEYSEHIFNGVNDTVSIDGGKQSSIKNSVINAFQTALNMQNGELSVTDTVLNGGADISYTYDKDAFDRENYDPNDSKNRPENVLTKHPASPVVKFSEDSNKFSAYGKTVINGDIKVDSNDNEITLGLHSQLNGNIIGKDTDDDTVLNLGALGEGEANDTTLNIQDNITNIKNINIENSVTLYEDISITGVDEITIKEDGVLNLRLAQSDKKETVTIDGQEYTNVTVAEHALDGNSGFKITGLGSEDNTGKLNFVTNGIGKEIYVPTTDIEVENMKFDVSSGIDKVTVENDFIFIGAGKDLDDIFNPSSKPGGDGSGDSGNSGNRYEQLNKIYKSIYSSGGDNLDALRNILSITAKDENYDGSDKDEQLKSLMNYLNGVYSHSPYAFSSELSRKSVGMFRDIVTDNSFIPNYKKWLVMGGLTHQDAGTTDTYYGKNYHGFDTGTADVDADSKLTGAYVLAKYGYSDKVTLGITAGGNKGDSELSTDSKVKDNAGYVGGFVENYRGNLTLKAGAGVQYSEFDATRKTVNDSYSDKYSDMAYDIYGSLRYSLPLDNNFFLEPYGVLSYTHVDQEGADEGNKALAIETDDKEFNYTTLKTGVDLKKVIPTEKAKHTLTAGVSYERFLDGDDEEYITGRMKGGTDFDILVAHKNKHQISLNAKYEVERQDGILFNVKGEYSFERDEHNNEAKNKTAGEWTVGVGIGYKF